MSTVKPRLCFSPIVLFLICYTAHASIYYIDANNSQANDGNAGSQALPWKTIAKANQALVAGDTVFIKAGIYADYIAPSNSGTGAKPITFMNFASDTAMISNAGTYGVNLNGKSYIVIQGLHFRTLDRFLYIRNRANYNIIAWCVFDSAKLTNGQTATWAGSVITGSSQHNWIHHCRFSNYGYYNADDVGCVLDIGSESDSLDTTRYNLIEESQFFHGGHHVMGVYGKYNVIRNNYFHNEPYAMGTVDSDRGAVLYGDRNLSFSGYSRNGGRNLFEGNRVGYSSDPSDNIGASGMSMNSSQNIIRRNSYFNNISAGLSMSVTSSYLQDIIGNRVYNNSFFNNGHNPFDPTDHMSSGIGFGIYSGPLVITGNALKNNILYKHRIPFGEYNINTADRKGIIALQAFANNWDGDTRGNPRFMNADTGLVDPMNSGVPDLRLQSGSPCIDSGTFLTTIVSTSGSGTSFQLADAGHFMDGWGINGVSGDEIQLYGTNQRARITAVNYPTNMLTFDKSLTWTQNQGICLSYQGSAPDIGAFEYGSGNKVIRTIPIDPHARAFSSFIVFNIQGRAMSDMNDQRSMVKTNSSCRSGVYFAVGVKNSVRMVKKIAVAY